MSEWACLRALVFDLDGTLYDSPALLAEYPRLAIELTACRLGLSRELATARFEHKRREMVQATGKQVPTTRVLVDLTAVTIDEWADFAARGIKPADFLDRRDYDWLSPLLARLHRHYRLGLVSNNNRVLTGRILELLGIAGQFDAILTLTESRRIKPDPTLYADIAAMLGVAPECCLSIGDRLDVDILPAEQAGMRGTLMRGPAALRPLAEELIAAAEARGRGTGEPGK